MQTGIHRIVTLQAMPELTHVFDANHDNFQTLAVENSHKGLVLVNFWTPGVGPCLKLWEALEALVEEYQGRFLLVNVNTESQRQLVRDNGITSVPTVKLYQRGKVVDSIHGAQSANALRQVLNQYIPSLQAQEKVAAIRAYQQGEVDSALKILAEACMKNPDNRELHATAMKLLLREQRLDDLMQYHAVLPDKVRQHNEILALVSHGRIFLLRFPAESPVPGWIFPAGTTGGVFITGPWT